MGEHLSGGNVPIALLGNMIPTGAILFVLITMFGPISVAHFNPAVTAVFLSKREIGSAEAVTYVVVQIVGAVVGVLAAHLMFGEVVLQVSAKLRAGQDQWFSEWVAAFGLIATILLTLRANRTALPLAVGLCGRLLVYGLDVVCESGSYARASSVQWVRRHPAC